MPEDYQPAPDTQSSEQSRSKAETIELLQKTIGQLESILEQLSTSSEAELPPMAWITPLVASTQALADSLEVQSPPQAIAPTPQEAIASPPVLATEDEGEAIAPPIETDTAAEAEALTSPPIETDTTETEALTPTPIETDTAAEAEALTSPPVPKTAADVTVPPAPPQKPRLTDRLLPSFDRLESWWDAVLNALRALLPEALSQKLSDWALTGILTGTVVAVLLTSVLLFSGQPPQIAQAPPAEIETPPELKAPAAPQPVATTAPPEPTIELTPEQSLIAAIQDQVDQITSQYAEGLIQTIEANFTGSRLIVQVSGDWYTLKPYRQNKLANQMLRRSQELDFRKLELIDPQGTLIARSPVVGQEMVILQRSMAVEPTS